MVVDAPPFGVQAVSLDVRSF